MPNDTSQVTVIAGYQPDEAGLTAQVTGLVGYQPDEAGITAQVTALAGYQPVEIGLAAQLATLVGYRYPVAAADTSRPNAFMWSSANSVVDSRFFSGSFVAGEED